MSAWRRVAGEYMPWGRKLAEQASSPMALWIEILLAFERAFDSSDTARTEQVLQYARWCWNSSSSDLVNAVGCAFFEHLPEHSGVRKAIPSLFSRAEYERLREVFKYHGGDAAIAEFDLAFKYPHEPQRPARKKPA
jgi:hypothetical protein